MVGSGWLELGAGPIEKGTNESSKPQWKPFFQVPFRHFWALFWVARQGLMDAGRSSVALKCRYYVADQDDQDPAASHKPWGYQRRALYEFADDGGMGRFLRPASEVMRKRKRKNKRLW